MLSPALSLESILTAMACLCSTSDNGAHNFYTSLGNVVNMKYPNESIAIVKPNEITEISERLSKLEVTLAELKIMQSNILEAINSRSNTYNIFDECPADIKQSQIKLRIISGIDVLCEDVQGVQWIVVENRKNGVVDFNQPWNSYEYGFGEMNGEFFMGLEKLHLLTAAKPHELRVEMEDHSNVKTYAKYDLFRVGNASEAFEIKAIGAYTGDGFDFFYGIVNAKFSTFDRDNDAVNENCAESFGAWWHIACISTPHARYNQNNYANKFGRGINWRSNKPSPQNSLKSLKIMIRPKSQN